MTCVSFGSVVKYGGSGGGREGEVEREREKESYKTLSSRIIPSLCTTLSMADF